MATTRIEWAEKVWNPVTGCTKISQGCANCYAERMAKRLAGRCGYPADKPFKVTLHPGRLDEPLLWKKPSRIFVCSMSDLFHDDVPDSFLDKVFAMMAKAEQHIFLILTKRPERMHNYIIKAMYEENCVYQGWYEAIYELGIPDATPMSNVWLGVTAENQEQADKRIPILLQTPAARYFVSVEPMLSQVDLTNIKSNKHLTLDALVGYGFDAKSLCQSIPNVVYEKLDWVICGGESGPGARPMHPDWVRSLRDQCQDAGVPFLFKQWGEYCAPSQMPDQTFRAWDCYHGLEGWDRDDSSYWKVGKKKAGRLLDGKLWNKYPV